MWNKEAAINFVRHNAHPHATGYCARAVTAAIEHGGVSLHHDNAKNMGKYLVLAGFREVYGNPVKGDVAIIQPYTGGNAAGHMAIFDGHYWWSDFKQEHGVYPDPGYRKSQPSYKLYRHN
ncbi:Uncharacterised protein [Citrobacter youngae]|uniref:CHAP domain-containing protein n=1 Tax=Citrobacter youngae TaxID=133448 RepID=A0A9Q7ZNL7_9ENTR|nr:MULTISPECIES: hypothetical protein [Citrobacter]MDM2730027.1 hypothetical protein [Citrobacter sp. Cy070]SUX79769.1 Uncharacterised protein [Citrobacter youngae]